MEKFLDEILKSDILSEDTKVKMREQFNEFVENVRNQAKKDVAEQYKRDREKIINSADTMITEALATHIKEFKQDFDQLDALKKKASKAIVEANKKADQKVSKALTFFESQMNKTLSGEMKDLLEDRRLERQAVANTIKETKARSDKDHQAFVQKGAKMIDFIIEKEVKKILKSLHKDIIQARQNNFGRKIFEAYVAEFETSMFSHDAHSKKLATKAQIAEAKLEKIKSAARNEIVTLRKQLQEEQTHKQTLEENVKKQAKIANLLKPLRGAGREQMKELLEAASYSKLDATYRKFLNVVTEKVATPQKKKERVLSSFHTGAKTTLTEGESVEQADKDIILLQKRAGIKR